MKRTYTIISLLLFVHVCAAQQIVRAARPDAALFTGSASQVVSCGQCKDVAAIVQLVGDINNGVQNCCNNLDANIQRFESIIDEDINLIFDALSGISNVDIFISRFETLFSFVESLDQSLLASLVTTIKGLDSSFDQVSSLLDYDIAIDQTTLSKVFKIDTQMDVVESLVDVLVNEDCASTAELIASDIDELSITAQQILLVTEQILELDQTIASHIDKLDTQLDAVESSLDVTVRECASRSDILISDLQSLQEQEASCCVQLSSDIDALQADIDSRLDHIQETVEGLSNVETLISQLSLLVSVIEDLNSALFVSLLDTTVSQFDVVTSQLDTLFPCGTIAISAATTITVPGNYCLDQDISGNITIAASGVTLDLSTHQVSGSITLNAGLSNIKVTNGFIDAGGSPGINIPSGPLDTIVLTDLHIINGSNGVYVFGSVGATITNLFISHVVVENCSTGFFFVEAYGTVNDSAAYGNSLIGFYLLNSLDEYIMLENNSAYNNGLVGFLCDNIVAGTVTNYRFSNCTSYANGGYGFNLGTATASSMVNIYLSNCVASNNSSDGFLINNVGSMGAVTGVIADCTAIQNGRAGFNTYQYNFVSVCSDQFSCFRVRYTGNYAADNQLVVSGKIANYAVAGVTPTTNSAPAPYWWISWNNVDAGRWINTDGNN